MCFMPDDIICYFDGTEARIGDVVCDHGDTLTVEDVVTPSCLAKFGVQTPGLMLVGLPWGRLFRSINDFEDEDGGLVFVARHP
jgi:hypothetical protein